MLSHTYTLTRLLLFAVLPCARDLADILSSSQPRPSLLQSLLKLKSYLQPSAEQLQHSEFRRHHTALLFRLTLRASKILLESDPASRHAVRLFHGKTIFFNIEDLGESGWIHLDAQQPRASLGQPPAVPDVQLIFHQSETFLEGSNNQLDSLAAAGAGTLTMKGLIPLASAVSIVMDRISFFLKK